MEAFPFPEGPVSIVLQVDPAEAAQGIAFKSGALSAWGKRRGPGSVFLVGRGSGTGHQEAEMENVLLVLLREPLT